MTFVGKIFTVLVFVFSICFMVMASMVVVTHVNWHEKLNLPQAEVKDGKKLGYKYQVADLNKEIDELRAEKDNLIKQLNTVRVSNVIALAHAETEVSQLAGKLLSTKTLLEKGNTDYAVANLTMKGSLEHGESLSKEINELRIALRESQNDRDGVFNKSVVLTDKIHQLSLQKGRLEQTHTRLVAQYAQAKRVLNSVGMNVNSSITGAAPILTTIVTSVRKSGPKEIYVEFPIGSDDGIAKGHKLNVTRGGSFIGKVEVVSVESDRCVARSIPAYYTRPFEKNDKAKTITLGDTLIGQLTR